VAKLQFETEQFKHFVTNVRDTFWGDVYGKTKQLWKEVLEGNSEAQMADYLGLRYPLC